MSTPKYRLLSKHSRSPLRQIAAATWSAALGFIVSVALIAIVCLTTNDKPTADSIWTGNAAVFVAIGGIILRGSLASLLGIAIYHRLWLLLGRQPEGSTDNSGAGLEVKEIESHHLASRFAIGMLFKPSASFAWACGILGLLLTSAVVPALQYGMDIVSSSALIPRTVDLQHAQLDDRMALKSGAAGYPDNVAPNVLRAATVALFGADSAFVYTKSNVSGEASFADIQYADVECKIEVTRGEVQSTSRDDWYYNFTYDYITAESALTSEYNYYQALTFRSTLNNNSHYLHHDCHIRPATGTCSIRLAAGTGLMKNLSCVRTGWMTQEQLPDTVDSAAVGFFAVSVAFMELFQGEAWTSAQQGRPQQNSTFVAATARYFDRSTIGMPVDLLSHVQRTLWHTAINARPVDLPASDIGGQYDLNRTVEMLVQDETPVLLVKVDFVVIAAVLGVAVIIFLAALFYLITAANIIPGRLMRDSLVHTLSVAVRQNGSSGTASALHLPHAPDQSLERVLKTGGETRLRCTFISESGSQYGGRDLVLEQVPQEALPMHTNVVHHQAHKTEPLVSRGPSPRPRLYSLRQSYQRTTPSISPEPLVYFHDPDDFRASSRHYRVESNPGIGRHPATQGRRDDRSHGHYEAPSVQCNCSDPEHHRQVPY